MKIKIGLFLILLTTWTASAAMVPVRRLEGEKGFEQALAIQQKTKLPILVWATWHECPYCGQVTALLNKTKMRQAVKDYPHVIDDEHGRTQEAAFAKEKGFHGGTFYIFSPAAATPKEHLWAWKSGDDRVILDGLEGTLAAKLAAAKQQ